MKNVTETKSGQPVKIVPPSSYEQTYTLHPKRSYTQAGVNYYAALRHCHGSTRLELSTGVDLN